MAKLRTFSVDIINDTAYIYHAGTLVVYNLNDMSSQAVNITDSNDIYATLCGNFHDMNFVHVYNMQYPKWLVIYIYIAIFNRDQVAPNYYYIFVSFHNSI